MPYYPEEDRPRPRQVSDRSRGVALALATVLGPFGAHRFYVGKVGTGIGMLCTFGGLGIWWLYDLILVASGAFRDAEDRPITEWAVYEETLRSRGVSGPQLQALLNEMDGLRGDVMELAERVDFMERMLARGRDRDRLPPPDSTEQRAY